MAEIERKWLLDKIPENLDNLVDTHLVHQSYLSIKPEVRLRKAIYHTEAKHFITVKSDGNLIREEVDILIKESEYEELFKMIPYRPILKNYYKFKLPNGLFLEVSVVDPWTDHEFIYSEIEFPAKEDAIKYLPEFSFIKEITDDKNYKMKNYWNNVHCTSAYYKNKEG